MVKISIVPDVHLKLRRNAEFELNRFKLLIQHLQESDADIIIFNGDLLDVARPTLEEIKALFDMVNALRNKIIYIIAGNHEAVTKDTNTYDFLQLPNVHMMTRALHTLHLECVTLHLCHWDRICKLQLTKPADILVTHYRSAMEGLYDEEVDTSKFVNNYKLILLGDIHSRYSPLPHVFYAGSPYPIQHIKDSRVPFGYISLVINEGAYSWSYVDLDLPKKIRLDVNFKDLPEVVINPDYLYKIYTTGTLDELSTLSNTKNITYIKQVTEATQKPSASQSTTDVDFFDVLTEYVDASLTTKTRKTKQILLTLQED